MRQDSPKRKNIRLKEWDYSRPDAYFVTMCTQNRELLFGDVVDGKMVVNDWGMVVEKTWHDLPNHYVNVETDIHVVMPNHFHGIVVLNDVFDYRRGGFQTRPMMESNNRAGLKPAPTGNIENHSRPMRHALPEIVRALKTFSSRNINILRNAPSKPVWQRGFYEHIIRDENNYWRIAEYIANNPGAWEDDEENPARVIGRV